jgi:hypothetical protein
MELDISPWRYMELWLHPLGRFLIKYTKEQELFLVYHLHFTTIRESNLAIIFGVYFGPEAPPVVSEDMKIVYEAYVRHRLIDMCVGSLSASWVDVAYFDAYWRSIGFPGVPYEFTLQPESARNISLEVGRQLLHQPFTPPLQNGQ